jgi:hypothetical protein
MTFTQSTLDACQSLGTEGISSSLTTTYPWGRGQAPPTARSFELGSGQLCRPSRCLTVVSRLKMWGSVSLFCSPPKIGAHFLVGSECADRRDILNSTIGAGRSRIVQNASYPGRVVLAYRPHASRRQSQRTYKPDSIVRKSAKSPKAFNLGITICHYMVYENICQIFLVS